MGDTKQSVNFKAWAENAISFIRERGLEDEFQDWSGGWSYPDPALASHEARIADLEGALRPFAATAEVDIGLTDADDDIFQQSRHNRAPKITVGDFRRARRALHTEGE